MQLHELINLQSAILNQYNNNVWTTYGLYAGAIGWIMTSDKSRRFLLSNPGVRVCVVVAAGLTVSLEIGVLFFLRLRSESLYDYIKTCCLSELSGDETSKLIVLEINRITILFPIISSIVAASLCVIFITMIHHIKSEDTVEQPGE
jgi:hypothetical protein